MPFPNPLQRYNKKLIYARKNEFSVRFSIYFVYKICICQKLFVPLHSKYQIWYKNPKNGKNGS